MLFPVYIIIINVFVFAAFYVPQDCKHVQFQDGYSVEVVDLR